MAVYGRSSPFLVAEDAHEEFARYFRVRGGAAVGSVRCGLECNDQNGNFE